MPCAGYTGSPGITGIKGARDRLRPYRLGWPISIPGEGPDWPNCFRGAVVKRSSAEPRAGTQGLHRPRVQWGDTKGENPSSQGLPPHCCMVLGAQSLGGRQSPSLVGSLSNPQAAPGEEALGRAGMATPRSRPSLGRAIPSPHRLG